MNKQQQDCLKEKWSARTIGFLLLPLAIGLGLIGAMLVPIVGFFFAIPIFIFSFMFIFAPDSKACRIIFGKGR